MNLAAKKTSKKGPQIRGNRTTAPAADRKPDGTFQKGVSGNPGGRPASLRDFEQLAREIGSPKAFKTLMRDMDCGDPRAEVQSALGMLAYAWGKPRQAVEVSGPDGGPVKTEQGNAVPEISLEQARRLRAIADRMQAAAAEPPAEARGAGGATS